MLHNIILSTVVCFQLSAVTWPIVISVRTSNYNCASSETQQAHVYLKVGTQSGGSVCRSLSLPLGNTAQTAFHSALKLRGLRLNLLLVVQQVARMQLARPFKDNRQVFAFKRNHQPFTDAVLLVGIDYWTINYLVFLRVC